MDVKGQIEELINRVYTVERYSEQLLKIAEKFKDLHYTLLTEVPGWIKVLVTSGLSEQLQATEPRSLARMAEVFLGIGVKDPKDYFIYLKQNLPPAVRLKLENGRLNRTVLGAIMRLSEISDLTVKLSREKELKIKDVDATPTYEEVIIAPEKLIELINNFIGSLLEICVGVNKTMNIVYGLRRITRKYLKDLYPELFEEKTFKAISKLLGLKILFEPQIPDEEKRRDYTILGYPDYATDIIVDEHGRDRRPQIHTLDIADPWLCATLDYPLEEAPACGDIGIKSRLWPDIWCGASHITRNKLACLYSGDHTIGGLLCKVNNLAWTILEEVSKMVRVHDWNVKDKYLQECQKQLLAVKRPEWLNGRPLEFTIDGAVAKRVYLVYHKDTYITEWEKIGLLELLDLIEPFIHLGLCELILKIRETGVGPIQEFHIVWRKLP